MVILPVLLQRDIYSEPFLDTGFVLDLLPEGDGREKENIYMSFLAQGKKLKVGNILEEADTIDRFRSDLYNIFPSPLRKIDDECLIAQSLGIDLLPARDLENKVEEMRMRYFTNNLSTRLAKKQIAEQLIARGYKRSNIAKRLGISRKTVYRLFKME